MTEPRDDMTVYDAVLTTLTKLLDDLGPKLQDVPGQIDLIKAVGDVLASVLGTMFRRIDAVFPAAEADSLRKTIINGLTASIQRTTELAHAYAGKVKAEEIKVLEAIRDAVSPKINRG